MRLLPTLLLALGTLAVAQEPADPTLFLRQGMTQKEADHIVGPIYKATGFGNTFLLTTDDGNVIIDTSLASSAPHHYDLLTAVSSAPIDYLILTHGHSDHTGGIGLWRSAKTRVIAHANSVEFLHYQERLRPFFSSRNAAQFGFPTLPRGDEKTENFGATIPATVLFDKTQVVELGNLRLVLMHAPAETYDALIVWVPELKAVFTGDLYYESFPNIYTLRGTKPRYALDYIASLNKVLALGAEYLLPSHGEPIVGAEAIQNALTRYRDAIIYVHDAVVTQLNQGASVTEAMRKVQLPADLDVGEAYGRVSWSVRGIYEGYAGWFDGNPATMYPIAEEDAYRELIGLAGGVGPVAQRTAALLDAGETLKALKLTDAVLAVDPHHQTTLELRVAALKKLQLESRNLNETGWLQYGMREAEKAMKP